MKDTEDVPERLLAFALSKTSEVISATITQTINKEGGGGVRGVKKHD